MPLQEDYHVTLEAFKGPLDLLLYLIRRAEVEVTNIPVAEITDQYLAFLTQIDQIDIDLAGEFLVMAATLVELKSRVLALRRARQRAAAAGEVDDAVDTLNADLDESDPRYELVQQLLAYQRYRTAAEELDHRRHEFEQRFIARAAKRSAAGQAAAAAEAAAAEEEMEVELDDAHIFDLFNAYERIVESIDFSKLGEHQVQDADTPIGLHQEDLVDRLTRAHGRRLTLQEAWIGRTKNDVIGLFLATLELVKQRRVVVVQDEIHGEIMLELNDDPTPDAFVEDDDDASEPADAHDERETGEAAAAGEPDTSPAAQVKNTVEIELKS